MTSTTDSVIKVRPGEARGTTRLGWLHSRHSFSFGRYYDPDNIGFRALRVINDDTVTPGAGFGEHGHDNMEILTWVLGGALRHGDSLGHGRRLEPGELQAMSAGSGIRHSEFNDSQSQPVHFLQVWIEPAERDAAPRYDQKRFDEQGRHNRWQTLASGRDTDGALPIGQDAEMRVADLDQGLTIDLQNGPGRHAYLHVATGKVTAEGQTLEAGDALTLSEESAIKIEANEPSQLIWFDLN